MVPLTPYKASLDPLYWVSGDPLLGLVFTGENDPTVGVCRETRREDAIFATLAEIARPQKHIYLDTLQQTLCLSARGRRDIEAIHASPHHSDCAATMEAQRVRREGEGG